MRKHCFLRFACFIRLRLSLLFVTVVALFASCVTQDVPDNTRRGNFEALWQTLDQHYCFFDY